MPRSFEPTPQEVAARAERIVRARNDLPLTAGYYAAYEMTVEQVKPLARRQLVAEAAFRQQQLDWIS